MFKSLRLLAAEPAWKKFFTGDRASELDYLRCFKDLSDPYRLVMTFKVDFTQDAASNEFQDMSNIQMLKTLSIYGLLHFHTKRITRDVYTVESFWQMAKDRIETGAIEWTPVNLNFMCEFIYKHQTFALENLQQATLGKLFQTAIDSVALLRLPYLTYVVLSAGSMPSFYPKIYDALVAKFNTTPREAYTDFNNLDSEQLRGLTRALFLRPLTQPYNSIPVSATSFKPEVLKTFQDTIISRLQDGYLDIINVVDIMEAFHNLTDKTDSSFDDKIMNWLLKLLDPAEDIYMKRIDQRPAQIIELAAHIAPTAPMSKLIFRLASNRFFLRFVMAKGPNSMALRANEKLPIIINYIRVAAKHKIFQVVYLDQAVSAIVEMIDSTTYSWTLKNIAEALKGLAELNYPGRFNASMLSKEHQWKVWQALLARCEVNILKKFSDSSPKEQEVTQEEDVPDTIEVTEVDDLLSGNRNEIIDILWAFSVFDYYSKPFLSEALNPVLLASARVYSEEQYAKLLQVHYWLKHEYMGEFKLDPLLEAEILDFKAGWDKQSPPTLPRSDLKETIHKTLVAENYTFTENHRDFPYVLDFVSVGNQKEGLQVEDDSSYVEGSEGLVRPGHKRLENRQLTHLNWIIKRFSLKSWLKSGNIEIFSR